MVTRAWSGATLISQAASWLFSSTLFLRVTFTPQAFYMSTLHKRQSLKGKVRVRPSVRYCIPLDHLFVFASKPFYFLTFFRFPFLKLPTGQGYRRWFVVVDARELGVLFGKGCLVGLGGLDWVLMVAQLVSVFQLAALSGFK